MLLEATQNRRWNSAKNYTTSRIYNHLFARNVLMALQKSMIWSLALSKWRHGYSPNKSSVTSNWWSFVARVRRPRADFFAITGNSTFRFSLIRGYFSCRCISQAILLLSNVTAGIVDLWGNFKQISDEQHNLRIDFTNLLGCLRQRKGHNLARRLFSCSRLCVFSAQITCSWQFETTCYSHLLTP